MKLMVLVAIMSLALTMLASGCSLGGQDADSEDWKLLTRSSEPDQGEMTAIIRGTLQLDPTRGCVLLSGKPVVWPADTTLVTDPLAVHLSSGLVATSGDTIAGTGGEIPGARIDKTKLVVEGDVATALDCAPENSEVVVFTVRGDQMSISPG